MDIHAIPTPLQGRRRACVLSDAAQTSRANTRQEVDRLGSAMSTMRSALRTKADVLDQLEPLQARVSILADDDVVVHGDAERFRHLDDRLGHLDVGARRRRVAGRMVMDQYDGGGGELEDRKSTRLNSS